MATESAFGPDDYRIPRNAVLLPANWPRVRANVIGVRRSIFAEVIDYTRKVGDDVTTARALRKGRRTDNYLALAPTVRDQSFGNKPPSVEPWATTAPKRLPVVVLTWSAGNSK